MKTYLWRKTADRAAADSQSAGFAIQAGQPDMADSATRETHDTGNSRATFRDIVQIVLNTTRETHQTRNSRATFLDIVQVVLNTDDTDAYHLQEKLDDVAAAGGVQRDLYRLLSSGLNLLDEEERTEEGVDEGE